MRHLTLSLILFSLSHLAACAEQSDSNAVAAQSIARDLNYKHIKKAYLLAIVGTIDGRPVHVDNALLAIKLSSKDWLLVYASRNPQRQDGSDEKWHLHDIRDSDVVGYCGYKHVPTKEEISKFIQDSRFKYLPLKGFRIQRGQVFPDAWKEAFDMEPIFEITRNGIQ